MLTAVSQPVQACFDGGRKTSDKVALKSRLRRSLEASKGPLNNLTWEEVFPGRQKRQDARFLNRDLRDAVAVFLVTISFHARMW